MLPGTITTEDEISQVIRNGLKDRVAEIVDEESKLAAERVADRVSKLKEGAMTNILTRFKMTRREEYGNMKLVVEFNL